MRLGLFLVCLLVMAAPARGIPLPGVPHFLATCTLSHRAPNDPIVHFGMPGMSHMHDFFGNVTTNASSTAQTLRRGRTSCHPNGDRSGYWVPTLYVRGKPASEAAINVYFEASPGRAADVRPFPYGLKMLAGFPMARRARKGGAALWSCTGNGDPAAGSTTMPVCPRYSRLRLVVRFPDCWDGRHLDSPGHRRHMAYSSGGVCPPRAPVLVPRVRFDIEYASRGSRGAQIASGPGYTAHGDFFNAWRPTVLAARIDHCLHGGLRCNFGGQPY
jgi:hypothetical protein